MRKVFTLTFVCFLSAICAGATKAQERPIDFSSRGANVLGAPGAQSLSLPSQAAPAAVVASFLRSRGFLPETVASLVVKKAGRVSRTGITHLRFAQEVEGFTVYGTYVKAAVNDDGELVHLIENLATPSSGGLMPTAIGESTALDAALDEVHPGVSVSLLQGPRDGNATRFSGNDFFYRDPTVTRVAIPMASGVLEEGFLVETWTEEGNLLHHTLIDGTGRVLQVELRTNNDNYNIFSEYPVETPQEPVAGPGAGNAESPSGWLNGSQTTVNITGNNAHAYLDWDDSNSADPGGSAVTDGIFDAQANLAQQPYTSENQEVAVQNLFYFNNVIHDRLYLHGFDEEAGNFQASNFGNGGLDSDPVDAEAQDKGGATFNNANFATPLDGSPPRMQMYLWNPGNHTVEINNTTYNAGSAMFGPTPTSGLTASVVVAIDGTSPTSDGCEPLINGTDFVDKIVLIDRGLCNFVVKVQNAEDAGAVGVIVVNNDGSNNTVLMADNGFGGDIGIPSVFVGQFDGDEIKGLVPAEATLGATQLMRDGDVDSDIIWHEYGHGLTWRMIGGMTGSMSGAIGEGMSDVLAILANDEDRVGEYSTGTETGIRSAPYTNYSRTYGDFTGGSVHFDGEIYAATIWRVWELFQDAEISQQILFHYLIDGMNYTAPGPAMEDMRDGILMSAAGSTHECLIWQGFAELGIGFGAEYSGGTVTESIALHPVCTGGGNTPPVALGDGPYELAEGGTLVVSVADGVLANDTDAESNPLTAVIMSWPSNGDLTLNLDGSFTFTHDGSETTSDSFTYTAYDGAASSIPATATITVAPVVDPPAGPNSVVAKNAEPSDSTAVVTWDHDGNNVAEFEIRREKQNKKGMWKGRATVGTALESLRTYIDASGNGTFRYQVRALGSSQNSDWMPGGWAEVVVSAGNDPGDPGDPGPINCKKKSNRNLPECNP